MLRTPNTPTTRTIKADRIEVRIKLLPVRDRIDRYLRGRDIAELADPASRLRILTRIAGGPDRYAAGLAGRELELTRQEQELLAAAS